MYLSIYGSVTIAEQLDTLPQGGSRWLKTKKSDLKPLEDIQVSFFNFCKYNSNVFN